MIKRGIEGEDPAAPGIERFFSLKVPQKREEPPDTGGGRIFSLDATFGLLATRWRLWRRGDS